jgi:uncharacterized protein (TIGR00156 family)
MHRKLLVLALCGAFVTGATAQFTGPGAAAPVATVASLKNARLGSYHTVSGNIVAHQRANYFTFKDASGEIRVEIESAIFNNRPVSPETKVRLVGELDQGTAGRYLWIKSLEIKS